MKLSVRVHLTLWYAALVAFILVLLGLGVFYGATWGLQRAANQELIAGIDGVTAFLQHKLAMHQMENLTEELREHSSLLPREKMFRVMASNGGLIYQPDAMRSLPVVVPPGRAIRIEQLRVDGRSLRTISRFSQVGSYRFLIQVAVDETPYKELMIRVAWLLALSAPLAGLLAAMAGYWMSSRALAPIHAITETANAIDARSLSRRLPLRGTEDELDRLSVTINRMLDRLAASYERIAQFTADASHELRTPVALIRSNAELLLMDTGDRPRVELGLAEIVAETDFMTRLIADLLTLARSGVDEASVGMELFELDEAIRAILGRATAQAAMRDIALDYHPPRQIVPLFGNLGIVQRVLMIFIDNAIKYTPRGGKIWISSWMEEESCGFSISDTGIGIEEPNHAHIFERFYRVDGTRTPREGGSGLGLSIARSLVELHGGIIRVKSQLGSGATFDVVFPRVGTTELSIGEL